MKDFKILFSRSSENEKLDLVFVGYGIEEPDYGWNDFEGLEVAGKMVIVLNGAPMKKGKPVLPGEIHAKYAETSNWNKLWRLSRKGAKGVIMVDESTIRANVLGWSGKQVPCLKYMLTRDPEVNRIPDRDLPCILLNLRWWMSCLKGSHSARQR